MKKVLLVFGIRLEAIKDEYERMSKAHNPYGDGMACQRIVKFMKKYEIKH